MSMKNIYQKLEGKELEFAVYVAEAVSGEEPAVWISFIQDTDKFSKMDIEESKQYLLQLNDLLSKTYGVLHSWNKSNTCYQYHEDWRIKSIDIYRKLCKHTVISDKFDLLSEE